MVVMKSEAGRAASIYFRPAKYLLSIIPYQSFGPLGLFTQDLVYHHHHTLLYNGCITNTRPQLLWFLQIFLFGIGSLERDLDCLQTKMPKTHEKKISTSFPYTFDIQLHCFSGRGDVDFT
ncbi:unnamed protein product [Nyctereutes procyonoides]|uniref:Transmembrane protein 254 n=1 Tax=Nyctereutes procyonoides TaxID=34880 RepID=A0A811ZYW0_NYCPR|nr:unnamed protein product [Nyctereutes procyonoides]